MKKIISALIVILVLFALNSEAQQKDFYGMWTLDIDGGSVGWLNLHEDDGFLDAELLWQGGSVLPVAHVYFADDNTLVVTRTREMIKSEDRTHIVTQTFQFVRKGDKVSGVMSEPSRDGASVSTLKFKGWKLPLPPTAPNLKSVKYGEPIQLFNGKDLSGWKLINPKQANGFKVV
ncbi:MAG TPA: hypothetical protein VLA03_00745, partial [Draconibacterium sp.]|nr:hypothetical protein [Draconibacterium sp.]